MPPIEIPGFYYDAERDKYFPVHQERCSRKKPIERDESSKQNERTEISEIPRLQLRDPQRWEQQLIREALRRPLICPFRWDHNNEKPSSSWRFEAKQLTGTSALMGTSDGSKFCGFFLLESDCFSKCYESHVMGATQLTFKMSPNGELAGILAALGPMDELKLLRRTSTTMLEVVGNLTVTEPINALLLNDTGSTALGGSKLMYHTAEGISAQESPSLASPIVQLESFQDHRRLLSGHRNGVVHLWDIRELRKSRLSFGGRKLGAVASIAPLSNDSCVLISKITGDAGIWDIRFTRMSLFNLGEPMNHLGSELFGEFCLNQNRDVVAIKQPNHQHLCMLNVYKLSSSDTRYPLFSYEPQCISSSSVRRSHAPFGHLFSLPPCRHHPSLDDTFNRDATLLHCFMDGMRSASRNPLQSALSYVGDDHFFSMVQNPQPRQYSTLG